MRTTTPAIAEIIVGRRDSTSEAIIHCCEANLCNNRKFDTLQPFDFATPSSVLMLYLMLIAAFMVQLFGQYCFGKVFPV